MNAPVNDPARCPLCGTANNCRLAGAAAGPAPCWCERAVIPEELLARVPGEQHHRACLCRDCVTASHGEPRVSGSALLAAGDYYLDDSGLRVFTADYLRRRGHCCRSGCRHCPYEPMP